MSDYNTRRFAFLLSRRTGMDLDDALQEMEVVKARSRSKWREDGGQSMNEWLVKAMRWRLGWNRIRSCRRWMSIELRENMDSFSGDEYEWPYCSEADRDKLERIISSLEKKTKWSKSAADVVNDEFVHEAFLREAGGVVSHEGERQRRLKFLSYARSALGVNS